MQRVIEASAPGRCGILGNPSDIYGGVVVSCSIPLRNSCRIIEDGMGRRPNDLTLWKAATARFPVDESVSVEWNSEVPRSSGLAGSTALLAATIACVLALRNEAPDLSTIESRSEFAELVRDIERYEANVMCGYQDAYMVVHGGLRKLDFDGKHPTEPGPIGSVATLTADRLPFLLATTGVQRLSGSVHGPMADRWLAGETIVVDGMNRLQEIGELGATALEAGHWRKLAQLMDENQRIIASLGGSGEVIDALIEQCRSFGATAAKLAGAGMGGTVLSLCDFPDTLQSGLSSVGISQFARPQPVTGLTLHVT
jgi:galactokinase/mevalonate kinase-like predicted kinase